MSLSSSNHTEVQDWGRDRLGWAVSGSKAIVVISVGRLSTVSFVAILHVLYKNYMYEHTWVKTAFHMLPYSVLDGPHKLAGADLCIHLSWKDEADLRSTWTKWEN